MNTLCGCGCRQRTAIATKTDRRYEQVEGQPLRFIPGHNRRLVERHTTDTPAEVGPDVRRCARCTFPMVSQRHTPPAGWRQHTGRGLCSVCYIAAREAGELIDFERTHRTRDEVLDEWVLLRGQGHTRAQAAARMGMTFAAFDRAYWRARAGGDPRAVDGTAGLSHTPATRALDESFADEADAA